MIIAGLLSMALGLLYTQFSVNGSFWRNLLPGSLLIGVGVTLAGIPMTIAALSHVSVQDSGLASALINTSQQIGSAIVLALLVTIASIRTEAVSLSSGNALEIQMDALTEGFRFTFLIGAVLMILGAVVAMILIHGSGSRRSRTRYNI